MINKMIINSHEKNWTIWTHGGAVYTHVRLVQQLDSLGSFVCM